MKPVVRARLAKALLWAGLVAADSAAQLFFKAAALTLPGPRPDWQWVAMVTRAWQAWAATGCLLLTFVQWMLILRGTRLATAFPMTALTFIGVLAGSWWFFGESASVVQYAGVLLIVAGVSLLKPLES